MATLLDDALVTETLLALPGWEGSTAGIWRDVHLAAEQAAELRRQIEVDGSSMGHLPAVEDLADGTRFTLRTDEVGGVSELDIMLASHISDLAHRLDAAEPGIDAVRHGAPVAIVRPGEGTAEDAPMMGVPSVIGFTPFTPLPSDQARQPQPGTGGAQDPGHRR